MKINMKKLFLCLGFVMMFLAIIFIIYALNHPELSWKVSIRITNIIYMIYLVIMIIMFILAFVKKK